VAEAGRRGWRHRWLDDRLFDGLPADLRARNGLPGPVRADVARLIALREALKAGHDPVIWLDADVVIFDPPRLAWPVTATFALGRENWVEPDARRRVRVRRHVHNAVLWARPGDTTLPFLIDQGIRLMRRLDGPPSPQLLGPKLLTALHNIFHFPVIEGVTMASPWLLADLAGRGDGAALALLRRKGVRPAALNLCASLRGRTVDGVRVDDALLVEAIGRLSRAGWPD
jgi:hypothetical protein